MGTIVLGSCTRLRARISERQCGVNRKCGTFACADCSGLVNIQGVEYQPVPDTPEPDKTVTLGMIFSSPVILADDEPDEAIEASIVARPYLSPPTTGKTAPGAKRCASTAWL